MSIERYDIIEFDLSELCKFSLVSSLFLVNSIFDDIPNKIKNMINLEELRSSFIEFYKDYKFLLKFDNEIIPIQYHINHFLPGISVCVSGVPNMSKFIPKDIDYIINANCIAFFFEKIWQVIVENIIANKITILDYVDKNIKIAKISININIILKLYENYSSDKEIMVSKFIDDLKKIYFYMGIYIKDVQYHKDGQNSKIFITF